MKHLKNLSKVQNEHLTADVNINIYCLFSRNSINLYTGSENLKDFFGKITNLKRRNGFTLIEIIVTIAILGILVLLAAPKFGEHVQTAELTRSFSDAKSIQNASERYFMDKEDWPRLTDDPYTSEEIKAYSEHIYDTTGKEVNLDPNGNYYNIDYNKLKEYIKVPSNKEDYILQNPVGKIFYMDGLTESGSNRVDYEANKQANLIIPSKPVISSIDNTSAVVTGVEGTEVKLDDGEWQTSPHKFTGLIDGKAYKAYSRFKATDKYLASKESLSSSFEVEVISIVPVNFAFSGSAKSFTVPATGVYKIAVWGAEGGTSGYGGKGGYAEGLVSLTKGEILQVHVGGQTGYNGGGSGHSRAAEAGGGATDVRRKGSALTHRIIVAGGGGGYGGRDTITGGSGGGTTGGTGGDGFGSPGYGGSQSSGGSGGSNNGTSGTLGQGGSNTTGSNSSGGGGGGGYYGGGAGGNDYSRYNDRDDSGGGGGSSYIGGVTSGKTTAGQISGNGKATITFVRK